MVLWVCFMSRSTRRLTGSGSDFKASQKTGHGLKSHPTDWEKPGIEPATPGLQDIGLSHTPRRLLSQYLIFYKGCMYCKRIQGNYFNKIVSRGLHA